MDPSTFVDPQLSRPDLLVHENLLRDISRVRDSSSPFKHDASHDDRNVIDRLNAWNDPQSDHFDPTVFVGWDLPFVKLPAVLHSGVIQPYVKWARTVVRMETDVVMLTHLISYFKTSVPSMLYLYYRFSWYHGVLHWLMQSYYVGTYTLMMHQHIHMNGVLSKK